jgi:hypothetical protein
VKLPNLMKLVLLELPQRVCDELDIYFIFIVWYLILVLFVYEVLCMS